MIYRTKNEHDKNVLINFDFIYKIEEHDLYHVKLFFVGIDEPQIVKGSISQYYLFTLKNRMNRVAPRRF